MPITIPILRSKTDRHQAGIVIGFARNPQARITLQVDVGFGDAVTPAAGVSIVLCVLCKQLSLVRNLSVNAAEPSRFRRFGQPRGGRDYRSLKLLATAYRHLRMQGGLDRKRQWDQGLEALGLTVEPSISKSRAGEQKAEYYVNYPSGTLIGGKKFLEQHLKKGTDRSERFGLRIYFFWDRTANLVVVGWLPSHLDTRQTWRTPDLATWIIQAFKRSPAPATPPPAQALGSLRSPPSPHR